MAEECKEVTLNASIDWNQITDDPSGDSQILTSNTGKYRPNPSTDYTTNEDKNKVDTCEYDKVIRMLDNAIHKRRVSPLGSKTVKRNKLTPTPNLIMARGKKQNITNNLPLKPVDENQLKTKEKVPNINDLLDEVKKLKEEN